MLKAAKCRPEKAMQNNTVTQRALAKAGRAPRSPPALPPGVSMLTLATQAEKAQERCFVSKQNVAEQSVRCRKAGHATAFPLRDLEEHFALANQKHSPGSVFCPQGALHPQINPSRFSAGVPSYLAHVDVGSTWGSEQLVTATT